MDSNNTQIVNSVEADGYKTVFVVNDIKGSIDDLYFQVPVLSLIMDIIKDQGGKRGRTSFSNIYIAMLNKCKKYVTDNHVFTDFIHKALHDGVRIHCLTVDESDMYGIFKPSKKLSISKEHLDKLEKAIDGWLYTPAYSNLIGMRIRRFFDGFEKSDSVIEAYLPSTLNNGIALWHTRFDDDDEEDLEYHEIELARQFYLQNLLSNPNKTTVQQSPFDESFSSDERSTMLTTASLILVAMQALGNEKRISLLEHVIDYLKKHYPDTANSLTEEAIQNGVNKCITNGDIAVVGDKGGDFCRKCGVPGHKSAACARGPKTPLLSTEERNWMMTASFKLTAGGDQSEGSTVVVSKKRGRPSQSSRNVEDSPPYVEKFSKYSKEAAPRARGSAGSSERRSFTTTGRPRLDSAQYGVEQLDIDTGALLRRYFSLKKACHCMNVTLDYVEECCLGGRESAYGFKWRFTSSPVEDERPADDEVFVPIDELLKKRVAFGDYKRSKKVNRHQDVEYELDQIVDDRDNAEYEAMLLSGEGQEEQNASGSKAALLAPEVTGGGAMQTTVLYSLPSLLYDQTVAGSVPSLPTQEPQLAFTDIQPPVAI